MKLTKKEALEKTIEMWTWLAKHPEVEKKDYFKENNIKDVPVHDRYCCEYGEQIYKDDISKCAICPICTNGMVIGCLESSSPYFNWRHEAHSKSKRTKYALEIVALAKEKLEELEGD